MNKYINRVGNIMLKGINFNWLVSHEGDLRIATFEGEFRYYPENKKLQFTNESNRIGNTLYKWYPSDIDQAEGIISNFLDSIHDDIHSTHMGDDDIIKNGTKILFRKSPTEPELEGLIGNIDDYLLDSKYVKFLCKRKDAIACVVHDHIVYGIPPELFIGVVNSVKPPKYRFGRKNKSVILTYNGANSVAIITMQKGFEHLGPKILDFLNNLEG